MTTVTIEVPHDLMAKLARQQEPIQEVVIAILEDAFGNGRKTSRFDEPSEEYVIRHLHQTGFLSDTENMDDPIADEWDRLPEEEKQMHLQEVAEMYFPDSPASRAVIRNRKQLDKGLSRGEMVDRLIRLGIVRNPEEWDTPGARRWAALSPADQQAFIEEMNQMYFPDSPASTYIIENRR